MAEETPEQVTLDNLLPLDYVAVHPPGGCGANIIQEHVALCTRCGSVVGREPEQQYTHERWHAAMEQRALLDRKRQDCERLHGPLNQPTQEKYAAAAEQIAKLEKELAYVRDYVRPERDRLLDEVRKICELLGAKDVWTHTYTCGDAVRMVEAIAPEAAEQRANVEATKRHHALLMLAAKGRQEYAEGAPDDQAQKLGFEADVFLTAANLVAQPNRIGLLIPYKMQTAEALTEVGVDYPVGEVQGDGTVAVREPALASTVPTVNAALAAKISQAIHDPGRFVARDRTWDDTFDRWEYESVAAWGARAVMSILAPEVEEPAEIEVCPSLYLVDDQLHACIHGEHGTDIQHSDGQMVWSSSDSHTVPSPWPLDREPPAGINVLFDPDAAPDTQAYLVRLQNGTWEWFADPNDQSGPRVANPWAQAVLDAEGDLIVVRP